MGFAEICGKLLRNLGNFWQFFLEKFGLNEENLKTLRKKWKEYSKIAKLRKT